MLQELHRTTVYASPAATQTYTASVSNGTCSSSSTQTSDCKCTTNHNCSARKWQCMCRFTKTLSVTATGTALTYQWQVDMGSGFVNITTGTPTNPGGFIYTGQTPATLSINSVMATMNGYKYRVYVSGSLYACTNFK